MKKTDHQKTDQPKALLLNATACFRQGRLQEAHALGKKVLEMSPGLAQADHLLGLIAGQRGEYESAIQSINSAIRNSPGEPIYHCNLALALQKAGRLEEALAACSRAITLKPDYAEAHYNSGMVLRDLGRLENAVAAYKQAIQYQPGGVRVYVDLGYTLKALGRPRMALAAFEQAVKLKPDYAEAHYNLGVALADLGRPKAALEAYEEAIRHKADFAEAHHNRGAIFKSMGRPDEAAAAYAKTIELRPGIGEVHNNLAIVLHELNRADEAIKHLNIALSINPELDSARYLLAALGKAKAPPQSPHKYVAELFDEYAGQFDNHLTGKLNYQTPQHLYDLVSKKVTKSEKLDILDLGCGTGLCGAAFSRHARQLVGIDLSPLMLAKAQKRGVYTELLETDVEQGLKQLKNSFDLVISGDVFVYIGDLDKVFSLVVERLSPGGLFGFSIEHNDTGEDYALRGTGRYVQSTDYIRRLAQSKGFDEVNCNHVILRLERGSPVSGRIFLLRVR